jgi:predicted DNA-binding transcriptional regulator YafY
MDGHVEQTDLKAEATPPTATLPDGPRRAWEMGEEDQVTARLLVDESRVESASKQLGPDVMAETQPDGSVIYDVPVVNYDAFRSFVLGFLEHAELLEPPEWRADIIGWLRSVTTTGSVTP